MLDSRTIIVLTALGAAMMSVGMLAVARTYPSYIKGIKWWAWGGCGQAVGLALLGARGPIPEVLSIIAGNTLVTVAQAVHYYALRDFTGKPRRILLPGIIVGATCLGLIYFTVHTPDVRVRGAVIALSAALLTFLCSQVVIGDPRRLHPVSHWLTGLGYLGCSTVLFADFLSLVIVNHVQEGPLSSGLLQSSTFLVIYITVVILSFGFLMMCNHRLTAEMLRLATLDPLTESYNRRSIEDLATREIARARRTASPFSLLLIDLDNFKAINDRYGHAAGDAVLQSFARETRRQLRAPDILGRFGGEEFIVLLPQTSQDAALATAERLRCEIADVNVSHMGAMLHVTISIGVATFSPTDSAYDTLIARADAALYDAKKRGRNQVRLGAT